MATLAEMLRSFNQSGSSLSPQTIGAASTPNISSAGVYRPLDFSNQAAQTGTFGTANDLAFYQPQMTSVTPEMINQGQQNLTNLGGSSNSGLGLNIPTLQLGLQGLNSLAGLYMGSKALGMARDQFDFQKQMANTNLENSMQAYNTSLEDRLRTRAQFSQADPATAQADYERLKMKRA